MKSILKPSLDWLLICIPFAVYFHHFQHEPTLAFILACVAIIPLAGWMGKSTEHLAERTSAGVGGLLNATFGNAAELIIAIVALSKGMTEIVKASLTGSIIGNILLVLGASFVAGGVKFPTQTFNARGARIQATFLLLAAIGLIAPAAFHHVGGAQALPKEGPLSVTIAIILLVAYVLGLWFSLKTHKHLFAGHGAVADDSGAHGPDDSEVWPVKKALTILLVATALVAFMSELLVAEVDEAAKHLGMNQIFVGVIVVAIIGNAAEHSTAILMALKNKMDLSIGIAIGSSIQIALFVAPLLVLLSYVIGPTPMNLVFSLPEVLAVVLAVAVTSQISGDGESNWLEGVLLLAVYLILGVVFYFLPVTAP
ncbi:MAG: calcium/proton exchanger [Verrucomicrobiales bacterium]